MSAEVEILVQRLEDVVQVPLQAVTTSENSKVCYVANGGAPEKRVVETGEFNESFIQIAKGLEPGEEVLLRPPRSLGGPTEAGVEGPEDAEEPEAGGGERAGRAERGARGDGGGGSRGGAG